MHNRIDPRQLGHGEGSLLDAGLIPLEDAAAALGIEPKRLRGYVWRNGLADPIGDADQVYGWSCRELAAKLATHPRESGVVE